MLDLNQNTLSQITNLIKTKKISSLEVTKFFIKNIEKAKKLNSFITTCFEKSLKDAENFDKNKNLIITKKNIFIRGNKIFY